MNVHCMLKYFVLFQVLYILIVLELLQQSKQGNGQSVTELLLISVKKEKMLLSTLNESFCGISVKLINLL